MDRLGNSKPNLHVYDLLGCIRDLNERFSKCPFVATFCSAFSFHHQAE